MIKATSLNNIHAMEFFTLASDVKGYAEAENLEALKLKTFFEAEYLPDIGHRTSDFD